jgi:hypothetical protein
MRQVLEIVMADGKPHRLDVVIEHGHRNARDTIEIFNDVKRRLKERRGLDLLGEIVTAKKHERAPLMVADFLASTYSMMRASRARGQIDDAELAPDPPKGQAGLTFLELLPDALHRLKEDFEADRQEAVTAWRARRPHAVGDKAQKKTPIAYCDLARLRKDPYPFSPRILTLRAILAKLKPEPVPDPLPPPKITSRRVLSGAGAGEVRRAGPTDDA